jgi:hypothetical protein
MGRGPSKEERDVMAEINKVLAQEEIWIKQRSRFQWLKTGDKNSAYFHAQVARRKRTNRISSLRRDDDSLCVEEGEIHEEIQNFYQQLYTSQGAPNMDALLHYVQEHVTDEMRLSLNKPFMEEEIKFALFQMHPSKAPGVDGITAGFFQRHWETVKSVVVPAVLEFLRG